MKQVIRLTESDIHGIVKQIINEIGYRAATLATGANMKAADELSKGNLYYGKRRRNNMAKLDKAAKLNYAAITKSVVDNVGRFTLVFTKPEKEGYLTSLVKFHFNEIIYLGSDCFIMQGITEMSKHPIPSSKYRKKPIYVQIQYDFQTQNFTEVVYCANGTIRRKDKLELITAEDFGQVNKQVADSLILYMTNCMYSIEDYQSSI